MPLKTAVAFLIFNRPDTTSLVFEAIRKARPQRLLVVADGPRANRPGEAELCAETQAIIDQVDWPCTVQKNISPVNLGLKERISSGLNWVFDEVEEAIILEDDCLPDASFFTFCEKMLEHYRYDERVMMISGTNYLKNRLQTSGSYCFSRYFAIWGWASWRRAWKCYDITMRNWPTYRQEQRLAELYPQEYMQRHIRAVFDDAYKGKVSTWDSQWFYSCLFSNGLSIVPRVNLISNIGTLGANSSGYSANNFFPVFSLDTDNLQHPQQVAPEPLYDGPFFSEQFKASFTSMTRHLSAVIRKRLHILRSLGSAKTGVA